MSTSFQYIAREHLDEEWYSHLLEQSTVFHPALQLWYLDMTSDRKWGLLCHNSNSWGIPLLYNSKIPIYDQLFMPRGLQQLHVIGDTPEHYSYHELWAVVTDKFKKGTVKGPHSLFQGLDVKTRTNYILSLSKTHAQIQSTYDSEHRRRLRKAAKALQIVRSQDVDSFFAFYKTELEEIVQHGPQGYKRLIKLAREAFRNNQGVILEAIDENEERLAAGFWIDHPRGVLFQHLVSSQKGKKVYASHCLIDQMIALSCDTERLFDFEGSDIEGVARLFRHFKPQKVTYAEWRYNQIPSWYRKVLRGIKFIRK